MDKIKYFYDTEFIEDGVTIDLVSIGIACEDNREIYLCNSDCQLDKANEWVEEHVLPNLPPKSDKFLWKPKSAIAQAVLEFMSPTTYGDPELWGYYSAYDHVVFCQLFGRMIDLPKGFPMHTMDIKQMSMRLGDIRIPFVNLDKHIAIADARWTKKAYYFLQNIEETSEKS